MSRSNTPSLLASVGPTLGDSDRPIADENQSAGIWKVRRPGAPERTFFAIAGLLRGLIWASPFFASALLWAFLAEDLITGGWPARLLIVGAALLLFWTIWGLLVWRTWMYAFTNDEVMVERGVLRISRVFVSYDHVQYLDQRRGPVQRRLALSTIELQTAGGGVRIFAMQEADAQEIERYVRRGDRQQDQL